MTDPTRREALQRGAAFLAAPLFVPAPLLGRSGAVPPSEKIRLALIGAGGMGSYNMHQCLADPGTSLAAVCDVQDQRAAAWKTEFPDVAITRDYREVLAREDVDAVVIATPPHWHCLQAVEAARAGKHIFLQKPMTLYPAESIAVRNAVRRHGVICQVGTQIHQAANYRRVVDWVRSGRLGEIGRVETFWGWNMGKEGIGHAPEEPAPDDIDFDLWCGPAALRGYNRLLVRDAAMHCSFWDYSGGWTPGMAPHLLDLPVWALQLGLPEKVTAVGGRYILGGDGDAPDTQDMLWQYPGLTVRWHFSLFNHHGYEFPNAARALGIYFHGLNGTLRTNYGTHEVLPQVEGLDPANPPPEVTPPGIVHEHEWLQCIREGRQPSCNVEYHFQVDMPIALGNLAWVLGRTIHFDPATERIVGDEEAARRALPEYRAPWRFPREHLEG